MVFGLSSTQFLLREQPQRVKLDEILSRGTLLTTSMRVLWSGCLGGRINNAAGIVNLILRVSPFRISGQRWVLTASISTELPHASVAKRSFQEPPSRDRPLLFSSAFSEWAQQSRILHELPRHASSWRGPSAGGYVLCPRAHCGGRRLCPTMNASVTRLLPKKSESKVANAPRGEG